MDSSATKKEICAAKTDLNLLLECLKCQMNCPDSQKQTLLTIYSICQQKDVIFDYFLEMGGVQFVYNLSQSSKHSDVKEAALFILGALAENYVFCQQALCRADIFTNLAHLLDQDLPLSLKTMAVYMVSTLVTRNRFTNKYCLFYFSGLGQTLVRHSGCISVLLRLFSTSFPNTTNCLKPETASQLYQLWASVSSALCGCVNNPQNEENQQMCMSIFPVMKLWLQNFGQARKDIIQPLCSFITMTVASQSIAQDCFASVGGLSILAQCVAKLVPESGTDPSVFKAAVTITRALCACVQDNAPLAASLAQHQLVAHLLVLLSCPFLHTADQLCIALMLGHCTEASEAHQRQLLQRGGLSKMIRLLADSQDEELKRAVTFVLHNCEQMTKTLGAGSESSLSQDESSDPHELQQHFAPACNKESYWSFSKEMFQRINQLERALAVDLQGGVDEKERNSTNSTDKWHGPPQCRVARDIGKGNQLLLSVPVNSSPEFWKGTPSQKIQGWHDSWRRREKENVGSVKEHEMIQVIPVPPEIGQDRENCRTADQSKIDVHSTRGQVFQTTTELSKVMSTCGEQEGAGTAPLLQRPDCAGCNFTYKPQETTLSPKESKKQDGITSCMCCSSSTPSGLTLQDTQATGVPDISNAQSTRALVRQTFSRPPAAHKRVENEKRQLNVKDHISLCSEIVDSEISTLKTPTKLKTKMSFRCSGCAVGLSPVNSRNFSQILHSCQTKCERHMVLMEVEDRFKRAVQKVNREKQNASKDCRYLSLTPLCKGVSPQSFQTNVKNMDTWWLTLTPIKNPLNSEDSRPYQRKETSGKKQHESIPKFRASRRRVRKNFTQEEVQYLLDGVKRQGPSWNCILWSYPFQTGRTNVDLAKKYRRLQKADMMTMHPS